MRDESSTIDPLIEDLKFFCKSRIVELAESWGVEDRMAPPVFRNRQNCVACSNPEGWQVVFSYNNTLHTFCFGFQEYSSLRYILGHRTIDSYMGLELLILHEFAHILNYIVNDGANRRLRPHGPEYQAVYKELLQTSDLAAIALGYDN